MRIILTGQVRGGKNNIKITRTGHRYPDPNFVKWSNGAIMEIMGQRTGIPNISSPDYFWVFRYTPEDNRRRDVPAILDAVFHCLEKACIVDDDRYIANLNFITLPPSKLGAKMVIDYFKTDDDMIIDYVKTRKEELK